VAQMLAETAESLARTARELKGISPDEWLIGR
jgi:sarcosine oxidase gamma subunit